MKLWKFKDSQKFDEAAFGGEKSLKIQGNAGFLVIFWRLSASFSGTRTRFGCFYNFRRHDFWRRFGGVANLGDESSKSPARLLKIAPQGFAKVLRIHKDSPKN